MSEDKPNITLSPQRDQIKYFRLSQDVSLKLFSQEKLLINTLPKEFIERLKNEPNLMQKLINIIEDELNAANLKVNYSVNYGELPAILVFNYAVEVLENSEVAKNWLKRPNRALGGAIPLDLLDTKEGVEQVYQLLTRIEFGVYS